MTAARRPPAHLPPMPLPARIGGWIVLLSAAWAAAAAGGCGIAYECRWAAAGREPTPSTGITGRWQGTWHSVESGHSGGLRCILTRDARGQYVADFRATYATILSFGYRMTLAARATDAAEPPTVVYFQGEEDAGWLGGGLYAYNGKVTPTAFYFSYAGKYDRGTFQLARPGGAVTP